MIDSTSYATSNQPILLGASEVNNKVSTPKATPKNQPKVELPSPNDYSAKPSQKRYNGKPVFQLDTQAFFDNKISLLIPSSFVQADNNFKAQKFPDRAVFPKLVLTDVTKRPIISLDMASNTGDRTDLVRFYRDIKNDIRSKFPSSRFLQSDVIKNRTLAIIEVIMPNNEGKNLYNLMAFRYVDNEFFFFNFSCPEEDINDWQDTAREISQSIKTLK